MGPVEIAFLYTSDSSKAAFDELVQFLSPLQTKGLILIKGFDITKDAVNRQNMADISIVACLINPAFLFFFFEEESLNGNLAFLLREKRVLPIIQNPSLFKTTAFADIAPLPSNKKPISVWSSKEEAYLEIATSIKKLAESIQFQQNQETDQEFDQNLDLIIPTEEEFYAELDHFEEKFSSSYEKFKASSFFWNYFVHGFGYSASRMNQAELAESLLLRERLIMREISAEHPDDIILTYIKNLYDEDIGPGCRICLVIYDLNTPALLNYDLYRSSFQEKYHKFLQILHETKAYQFDGKLSIAFKMFNRKEICSQ